ncbi:MAG: hypothetical protein IKF75_04340, partial [Lachnospiraceae bacterium]|nr:hypothetical protein [Lachnospiraceae bacterium]
MQDFLIELVKNAGADAWEITDVENYGWEFYFIKHKLDQNRVKRTEHTSVKLFKKSEDGKFLGSAVSEIAPTASREEAQAILGKLLFQASLVKNPVYTLNEKKETEAEAAEFDVSKIAGSFIRAMQELPETETEYINSYEIFVNGEKRRFLNSNGIDVTAAYPSSMIEVVVNAKNEDHEIELYRMYTSGACDAEALKEKLGRTLCEGRDRLTTKKTPALGTSTIALTTDAALEVYQYFANRMSCGYKYQGLSDYEIGEPVIRDAEGDALTITARSLVEVRPRPIEHADITWDELRAEASRSITTVEQLTQTRRTTPHPEVVALAREIAADHDRPGPAAHAIAEAVGNAIEYMQGVTGVHSTAVDAWEARKGVCQDIAHLALG